MPRLASANGRLPAKDASDFSATLLAQKGLKYKDVVMRVSYGLFMWRCARRYRS